MSLSSGSYIIKHDGYSIGRNYIEDNSPNPKRVVKRVRHIESAKWSVEAHGGDIYTLKTGSAPVVKLQDGVCALLLPTNEEHARWKIEHVAGRGPNSYIITVPDGSIGWIAPESEYEQIRLRPLSPGLDYPPNEVFEIIRADG